MKIKIAIVGRPNVGKSTLFNRLTGTRHALVDDTPGVTRDRREGEANLGEVPFTLIDTAGLEEAPDDTLQGRMMLQTRKAMDEADLLLLTVDCRVGISPKDETFAALVRESGKPCILVVNKAEGKRGGEAALEFYGMGLGDPVPISAEHGEGMGGLYDAIRDAMPPETWELKEASFYDEEEEFSGPMTLAVVGRPNVGKSTFINYLLKEDRLLTGPEAGITRDSITIPFMWKGEQMNLVDTAGMRKRANVQEKLEKLSVTDSRRSIQYAHVCLLLLDATEPLTSQDKHIAAHIADEGRACVIAVNKCDAVEDREALMAEMRWQIEKAAPQLKGVTMLPLTAIEGKGAKKIMDAVMAIYEVWNKRVPTAALNRWLDDTLAHHTPPLVSGRRLKIKYITQAKTRPPTFALFVNIKDVPDSYVRYLVGSLRDHFAMPGVPVRMMLRQGKNPYEDKKKKR